MKVIIYLHEEEYYAEDPHTGEWHKASSYVWALAGLLDRLKEAKILSKEAFLLHKVIGMVDIEDNLLNVG